MSKKYSLSAYIKQVGSLVMAALGRTRYRTSRSVDYCFEIIFIATFAGESSFFVILYVIVHEVSQRRGAAFATNNRENGTECSRFVFTLRTVNRGKTTSDN